MSAWYSASDAMLESAKHTKDTQVLCRYRVYKCSQ
jgi:hypothetical protein